VVKTLIEIDDDSLAAAQRELRTSTKKDTVNQALTSVVAAGARRRDLERLRDGGRHDLGDSDVMKSAWQR
jgi:Arc/MetJ family transcription regulator